MDILSAFLQAGCYWSSFLGLTVLFARDSFLCDTLFWIS